MAQNDEQVGRETYGFDAIRGIQAEREFYVAICPLKIIPKLFIFNDYEIPPQLRAQRTLRESRIPAIKDYILSNPKDYTFSSLTASVDGMMKFEPVPSLGQDGRVGRLYISMDSKLLINDGQHRRKAIEEALKENPKLGYEMISVVFFQDAGLKRSQQMFSDLNKNAIKPTKSLNILYDHRDKFSKFVVEMTGTIEAFENRVELERTTISNRSTKVFTLNGLADATMKLFGTAKKKRITDAEKETAREFWNTVARNMPEWRLLIQGKVKASEIRKEFVHTNTNLLNALGITGRILMKKYPDDWTGRLSKLRAIDWSRENPEWDGRLILNGQMVKHSLGIEKAANLILRKCGVKLSKSREDLERQ